MYTTGGPEKARTGAVALTTGRAAGRTFGMRTYAPFLTPRWWLLHAAGIAAVYAAGALLLGR